MIRSQSIWSRMRLTEAMVFIIVVIVAVVVQMTPPTFTSEGVVDAFTVISNNRNNNNNHGILSRSSSWRSTRSTTTTPTSSSSLLQLSSSMNGDNNNNNAGVVDQIVSVIDGTSRPSSQLFELDGWKNIERDLDRFPLWTVATAQGDPLAYTVTVPTTTAKTTKESEESDESTSFTIPMFWCDVREALHELETSREKTELDGLDIIPFPLGTAYRMWCDDTAVIVPSRASVLQAGQTGSGGTVHDNFNNGNSPIGQTVPMWACLDISEEDEDTGRPLLPIFMALDDANAAVTEAIRADGGKLDDFDVVCLSLSGAIEQLVSLPEESPSFHFIPPSTSMEYIDEYIES